MHDNRWARALVLTAVWTYAAATWASISHHLFGLPDLVTPVAAATAIGVATWRFRLRGGAARSARATVPGEVPSPAK